MVLDKKLPVSNVNSHKRKLSSNEESPKKIKAPKVESPRVRSNSNESSKHSQLASTEVNSSGPQIAAVTQQASNPTACTSAVQNNPNLAALQNLQNLNPNQISALLNHQNRHHQNHLLQTLMAQNPNLNQMQIALLLQNQQMRQPSIAEQQMAAMYQNQIMVIAMNLFMANLANSANGSHGHKNGPHGNPQNANPLAMMMSNPLIGQFLMNMNVRNAIAGMMMQQQQQQQQVAAMAQINQNQMQAAMQNNQTQALMAMLNGQNNNAANGLSSNVNLNLLLTQLQNQSNLTSQVAANPVTAGLGPNNQSSRISPNSVPSQPSVSAAPAQLTQSQQLQQATLAQQNQNLQNLLLNLQNQQKLESQKHGFNLHQNLQELQNLAGITGLAKDQVNGLSPNQAQGPQMVSGSSANGNLQPTSNNSHDAAALFNSLKTGQTTVTDLVTPKALAGLNQLLNNDSHGNNIGVDGFGEDNKCFKFFFACD